MNKLIKISIIFFVISLLLKYGVEAYLNRGADYPDGPKVDADELFVDTFTNTFYTSLEMGEDDLFTGTSVRWYGNGNMLAKAGILNGKLHGPFDSWYDNGQKQMSLIWHNGKKYRSFKAYRSNGERIEGDSEEISRKIFSGEMILE
jgi:antitoxin component YwqK of YwqJK toxin-antitoxin module